MRKIRFNLLRVPFVKYLKMRGQCSYYLLDSQPKLRTQLNQFLKFSVSIRLLRTFGDQLLVSIYFLKVNNGNTGAMCEIVVKLTVITLEQCHNLYFFFTINTLKTILTSVSEKQKICCFWL